MTIETLFPPTTAFENNICNLVTQDRKTYSAASSLYYLLYLHHVTCTLLSSVFHIFCVSFVSNCLSSGSGYHGIFWMLQKRNNNRSYFWS